MLALPIFTARACYRPAVMTVRWTVIGRKMPRPFSRGLCWRYLFSRPVTRQLSSAQMSLTSVFGMGTGGPSSQSTPTRMDELWPIFYLAAFSRFSVIRRIAASGLYQIYSNLSTHFSFPLTKSKPSIADLIWRRQAMTQMRKHSRIFSSNVSCVRRW